MKSEWKEVTLREISRKITKGTTPTTLGFSFVESGINFIRVESITTDGRLLPEKFLSIDEQTNQKLNRSIIEPNDVLFSIAGAIGRTCVVKKQHLPANTNQAVAIIRPDTEKVDVQYLYYALRVSNSAISGA